MATIKDVAKQAGVSVATVSRVVNNGPKVGEKTRQRVKAIMLELGYRPNENARALVTQKNKTIGVVIPDIADPFFAQLASGIDKIAKAENMQMLLSTGGNTEQSEKEALDLLLERQCQAIVLHSKKIPDEQLIELSEKIKGLVLIDRHVEQINERCIWIDNKEGGKIAARHIAALNHTNVACINSSYDIDDPKLRLNGLIEGLTSAGLTLNKEAILEEEPNQTGGQLAAQKLIASELPFTAIFAYNDAMAIGAISTLEDNGFKVPEDVSVVGFDDVILARYSRPKLTTLHYPVEEMAQQAALLSISALNNDVTASQSDNKHLPRLIKRESTISSK